MPDLRADADPTISVRDLHVGYRTDRGLLRAVRGVDLAVGPGERVGLIGESGSGKSTLVAALMGLLPHTAQASGTLSINGDVIDARLANSAGAARDDATWRRIRGQRIAAVPQGAMSGLHPTHRVDAAVAEVMTVHRSSDSLDRKQAKEDARGLLADVGLDERAARAYPHELSGGMRQRVALAAALACRPDVLIADEPTIGLDVVVAARFIDLLLERQRIDGFGLLIVSHDLNTVKRATDRVLVMYAGRIVEELSTHRSSSVALHPYSQGLFAASPSLHRTGWSAIPGTSPSLFDDTLGCSFADRCPHVSDECRTGPPEPIQFDDHVVECHLYDASAEFRSAKPFPICTEFPSVRRHSPTARRASVLDGNAVVVARSVTKTFRSRRWLTTTDTAALVDVDLDVRAGEIVGLVGVSGSGKSTLARSFFGLVAPESGSLIVAGDEIVGMPRRRLRKVRQRLAFVHQDPYASLHPAMSIAALVAEPLAIGGVDRRTQRRRSGEALAVVGLGDEFLGRRAGQLSGGQRQRVAIARALVAEPALIVLDEPMSMLDASVRAGIAAALVDVRDLLGMAAVVITHDLAEAAAICDRIVVLDEGRVVEDRPTDELVASPAHPATERLLTLSADGEQLEDESV